jgi:hypothetical protein
MKCAQNNAAMQHSAVMKFEFNLGQQLVPSDVGPAMFSATEFGAPTVFRGLLC